MDKTTELQNMVKAFSVSEKTSVSLVIGEKLSIKKIGDSFLITLDKKDIDTLSLNALKWGLQSHLSLIKVGRFPKLKKQFLFLVFPLVTYALSYGLITLLKLTTADSVHNSALGLTFLISYLGMSAWSRKKISEADADANSIIGKESGVEYLSFYPSFFQRLKKIS
jgi:hypothetical protein